MTTTLIATSSTAATTWDPYPLAPSTIIEGTPNAKVHWLRVSGPGEPAYYAGLWTVDRCVFDYVFEMNETAHILEGQVTVAQEGGPAVDLRAGDVASFPKGARTRWTVKQPLKKFFVDTP